MSLNTKVGSRKTSHLNSNMEERKLQNALFIGMSLLNEALHFCRPIYIAKYVSSCIVNCRYFYHILLSKIVILEIPSLLRIWNDPKLDESIIKRIL
jgi:hypothetical protein